MPNDDIPEIAENYRRFQASGELPGNALGFSISSSEIENLVLAPRAYAFRVSESELAKSDSYSFVKLKELIDRGYLQVSTGDEVGKLAYGTGAAPFVRTSDLSNWEIKSDPKHLLSDEVYQELAEQQDVQAGDILMVKDGSYLIGTCAMASEYDTKIVIRAICIKSAFCRTSTVWTGISCWRRCLQII